MIDYILIACMIGLLFGLCMLRIQHNREIMVAKHKAIYALVLSIEEALYEQREAEHLNSAIQDALKVELASIYKRYAIDIVEKVQWEQASKLLRRYML